MIGADERCVYCDHGESCHQAPLWQLVIVWSIAMTLGWLGCYYLLLFIFDLVAPDW